MGVVPEPRASGTEAPNAAGDARAPLSNRQLKRRLYRVSILLLLFGLSLGGLIYRISDEVVDTDVQYLVIDGQVHTIAIRDTKRYRHDLEHFGGKTALMFDDFYNWFAQLWQGKNLGKTVAWLAGLLAMAITIFARSFPDDPASGPANERSTQSD